MRPSDLSSGSKNTTRKTTPLTSGSEQILSDKHCFVMLFFLLEPLGLINYRRIDAPGRWPNRQNAHKTLWKS